MHELGGKFMKDFNSVSVTTGIVVGFIAGKLGGYDLLLKTLVMLVVADFVSGIIKGTIEKKLNPQVGFIGILKKVLMFWVVVVAVTLEELFNHQIPLREIVLTFYIANEGMSFFRNASVFIPFPQQIKDVFEQLQGKDKKGE